MLESNKLAENLWAEAMHAVEYTQNRVPHSFVKGKTPFEAYFRHKMDVSNLWVFHQRKFQLIMGLLKKLIK